MSDFYYAINLIPPPELVYRLSVAHRVMAGEFGTRTADKFQVHCTIKGFTKLASEAAVDDLIAPLDALFTRSKAFTTEISPPELYAGGPAAGSVLLWLKKGDVFQQLHNDVWAIVEPRVAPDCLFTPNEKAHISGPNFPPHITLIQSDLPTEEGIIEQAKGLAQHIYDTLPTHNFLAQDIQLVEYTSEEWPGKWWETLRFRPVKGWRLPQAGVTEVS